MASGTMRRLTLAFALAAASAAGAATEVSFLFAYDPARPEDPVTRRIVDLAKSDPELVPVKWGGLKLPGAGGRSTFMLALAASSAPDIYKAWFHILRHDIAQGFVYPLDEWTGPESAVEKKDLWDEVRCSDGHVWALPTPGVAYYGIVYRKDLVAQAGFDPESPPKTWDAFRDWCVALTRPGRRAFAMENRPWGFLPWVQSAGGDVVRRTADGSAWEACFDSPEALKAAEYLQGLVRLGVVRGIPTLGSADDVAQMFAAGEIVATFGGEDLVRRMTDALDVPLETVGVMPFPASGDAGGVRVLQAHRHFYAMSESVARRSREERDMVFKCLEALASPALADEELRRNVAEGRAQWCSPADLERLGFREEAAAMPKSAREMFQGLERGEVVAKTEPWVGFWQGVSDLVQRRFLGLLLSDAGPGMDCAEALRTINRDANNGLMFEGDRENVERARPYARAILGALLACAVAAVWIVLGARRGGKGACAPDAPDAAERPSLLRRLTPAVFLAPAVLSILVWSYYPLLRGAVMAFQDYKIVGGAEWTGLDNFIRVAADPEFWASWGRTLKYVAITLALGFLTPVVLAVMLCEIPKGKTFFRFMFFLPHLTSALVVTLLWKLMFDPTENGLLNQMLAFAGLPPQTWLLDPSWAMTCCIVPGVWAGAGTSALIYIAAIDSLPKDYIEAAAIDGAGIMARLRHVIFPQIAPLMVINFVGAFIAAFQGMGSIFLLTFGGPGDATQVVSLQIWKEAYNNLRFSTATTMAWFLGVALIGFTYLQVRLLRRVEFRRAGA